MNIEPTPNDMLARWDREHFLHPSTHVANHARGDSPTRIITGGEGAHIVDRDGHRLLDAFAGLYCVNVGYGRHEISDAIAEQAGQLAYYHAYVGHGSEASITLSKMIADRAPEGMNHVYFGLSGSDANETNLKLVRHYNSILGRPEKRKIISRWRGYHGSGLMTGSLTGLKTFHKTFGLPMDGVLHTHAPYYLHRPKACDDMAPAQFSKWLAQELDVLIQREGPDTVAAFVAEPVLGTGGIVPPPEGYWEAIMPVLQAHDVLLIADEVVTGFGRLGSMFGSDHYKMKPDLITIAKGLTSAYAPLSGSIVSDKVFDILCEGADRLGPLGHGWTYSAHPICAAAGIANLKLIDDLALLENARTMGTYLRDGLKSALSDHEYVAEIRGEGLLAAVELMQDRDTRKPFDPELKTAANVVAGMLSEGVIARAMPEADIIGLAPPLCLTRPEADKIIEALVRSCTVELGSGLRVSK
ncbi:MAG: aminotransferase class III-fold pyridoxal phosphate-dependent enzyme [Pseudomonadota bacterium]